MIQSTDFALNALVHEGPEFVLYRGRRVSSDCSILVRTPTAAEPSAETLGQLEHEWSMAQQLDSDWAIRPIELIRHGGVAMLVLEDRGAIPLDAYLQGPLAPEPFLRIAIRMADAVDRIHQCGIIHKDIKPENFWVDVAGNVRLTGFGIASRIPREKQGPVSPERVSGTWAYMAPEQTGRMNRSVDTRTDLYALGVTLYQLLTGVLPFMASEPRGWIHSHIAKQPLPPGERSNAIPAPLAEIVLKLLAKTAEGRYQTARGLRADLAKCLHMLEREGHIHPLTLGTHDVPEQLLIPEKLYGRNVEIEALTRSFERVAKYGATEVVVVSGYSGTGKSSVIHEFHEALTSTVGDNVRGYYASGKFDQYKRDIPYATLAQAFQTLVRRLLTKEESELARWRASLGGALGANGKLIANLIPDLKLIIGEQPPVPELPPQDAQNRFYLVFRRFIGTFARPEHPLTLFLDDLQWLDTATLELIGRLASDAQVRHLLLIVAYRDNEVTDSHPLARTLREMRNSGTRFQSLTLAPLGLSDLATLLSDALHQRLDQISPLAELILEKTGGNPFFAIQFITALAEEGAIGFDREIRAWTWDIERIRGKRNADNVIELMLGKLTRLSPQTQDVMKRLACLGNNAPKSMLAAVQSPSAMDVDGALWDVVKAGLVLYRDGAYAFMHDRVQEAAYALINEDERMPLHLEMGRMLLARTTPQDIEDRVFDIVNQLDRAVSLLESPAERERLAELNLMAGRQARASSAYASALRYALIGRSLLSEDVWSHRYALAFALELLIAECEFLTGEQSSAEQRLTTLAARAVTRSDRAAVTFLQVTLYTASGSLDAAVNTCLDYLRGVGIDWPSHPDDSLVRTEFAPIQSEISAGSIESRLQLTPPHDPEQRDTLDVLGAVLPPAFFTDQRLVCLVLCRMANLSRLAGNTDASALGYAYLGMVLGPSFGNSRAGYAFGKLGLHLVDQQGLDKFRARVYMTFAYHVLPYSKPMREGRSLLRKAFEVAQEVGDLTYAGFSCCTYITNLLGAGDPLHEVERETEQRLEFVRKAKFGLIVDIITTQLQVVRAMRGRTRGISDLSDPEFDEMAFRTHLQSSPALAIAECWYWIRKLQLCCVAAHYQSANDAAAHAAPLLWTTGGHFEFVEYHFYAALALAGELITDPSVDRQERAIRLAEHARQLDRWAADAPENFAHRAWLVQAEIAFIEGRQLEGLRLYEQAIEAARQHGCLQVEALAHEAAARFCRTCGLGIITQAYLRNARSCYARLEAIGKVAELEASTPTLRAELLPVPGDLGVEAQMRNLDLDTLLRGSHAVSGQTGIEGLIHTLMVLALEQAGAQRGLLICPHGNELWVEAEALVARESVAVQLRHSCVIGGDLPQSIALFVLRTLENVIIDDAEASNPFADDAYLASHGARSILCMPLVKQGKLVGLLYLENALTCGAFTASKISILSVLVSQAAIALESASLEEKEALLKEIHHRVKNNLQLVSSLLNLQASRVADPAVAELFTESRNRVRSMALVHENLYRAGSFARVDMKSHFQNLCAQLMRAYEGLSRRAHLTVEVDDVHLDVERAIPCGLILNELLVNCLKHAFPEGRPGRIRVELEINDQRRCMLCVSDDGVGIPAHVAIGESDTMGFQLIQDLTHQLRGALTVRGEAGTTIVVDFPVAETSGTP